MFYFAVHYLRWLARVPGLPQFFDALLLAWTCLTARTRLAAMEALEAEAFRQSDMKLRAHRFGGIEFARAGRELGHVHGCALLDVRVGRERAAALISAGRVRRHHVLPSSGWVSFQLETVADVPFALALLLDGERAIGIEHTPA